MDVNIDRSSPTVMVVSWTPLSYVEARGFISHYTVAYSPQTSDGRKRQATGQTATVPGTNSSATRIEGLHTDTVYSVQVSATTGGGTSELSIPEVPEGMKTSTCPSGPGIGTSGPVIGIIVVAVVAVVVVAILILVIVKLKLNNIK